jgi:hypothetical protein
MPSVKVLRTREAAKPLDREPALSAAQQRALADLQANGIAMTTFDDLVGDAELWQELDADMTRYAELAKELAPKKPKPERKDQFLVRRWHPDKRGNVVDDPNIPSDSPWLRFAASDAVLDVVNSYRSFYTKIVDVDNWYTVPFPEAEKRVGSQRWHRDPEEEHVVKCFLYFTDVDDEAGPFEYVPGSAPGGPYADIWPWGVSEEWYPPQEEFETRLPESARIRATGPRGTLVLCDTSGFHRGGDARTKPRILSTQTYVSAEAPWDKLFFQVDWRNGASFSPQGRYALT